MKFLCLADLFQSFTFVCPFARLMLHDLGFGLLSIISAFFLFLFVVIILEYNVLFDCNDMDYSFLFLYLLLIMLVG